MTSWTPQVKTNIMNFGSITNVGVCHKTRLNHDFWYGSQICEDPLGAHKSAFTANMNEVTLSEYKTIC